MRGPFALAMMLFVQLGVGVGGDPADVRTLQGTWEVVSVTTDGEPETAAKVRGRRMSFEFEGTGHQIQAYGGTDEVGTFALEAGAPKGIDFRPKGATDPTRAVYEVQGDNLRIAYYLFSERRPGGFEVTKDDAGRVLRVYVARRLRS